MYPFATIEDLESLWRPLKDSERQRAELLLSIVSNILRDEARRACRDLDLMIQHERLHPDTVKSVVVDIVGRTLNAPTTGETMTQYTQSALGYSVSGSPLSPGGGVFIKKTELARLGLHSQKIGGVTLWS